ncbi:MAG: endonuclease Q family protein, partial [Candidatus Micrarchaeaceae archaeon]
MVKVIADLHVHSRFARACSNDITLKGMAAMAKLKGISILSTGDFTNPFWINEIKKELESAGNGLYKLKGSNGDVQFAIGGEICTSSYNGKKQVRIHHCVLMSSIEKAEQFNASIEKYGNLAADGRATLEMDPAELVEKALAADSDAFIFPAHVWTPWYGALGAMSGFNSIKEVYKDMEKNIYALETGLSSDPPMNWRLSELDKYSLISNSDMHSIQKMGREANLFDLPETSYKAMIDAIKEKKEKGFSMTFEYYPEEGKYHYDGHRECGYSVNPSSKETICPVCGRKLVAGVLHRIEELADRPEGYVPRGSVPYMHLIPLIELISKVSRKSEYSEQVRQLYSKLLGIDSEFNLLVHTSIEKISEVS